MFDLDHVFSYHAPTEETAAYAELRLAARAFAAAILTFTPPSADQTDAVRKVREALMTAHAAVALDGRIYTKEDKQWST